MRIVRTMEVRRDLVGHAVIRSHQDFRSLSEPYPGSVSSTISLSDGQDPQFAVNIIEFREQGLLHLTHIAFLRVGPGLTPSPPALQSVGPEIETFMGGHIESFLGKVTKESAPPPGRFVEPAS